MPWEGAKPLGRNGHRSAEAVGHAALHRPRPRLEMRRSVTRVALTRARPSHVRGESHPGAAISVTRCERSPCPIFFDETLARVFLAIKFDASRDEHCRLIAWLCMLERSQQLLGCDSSCAHCATIPSSVHLHEAS